MYYNPKECGARIKAARETAGYTQEEMAAILNMSYSNYTKIERGKRSGSIDVLVRLAESFHVTLDYLIMGKQSENAEILDEIDSMILQLTKIKERMK